MACSLSVVPLPHSSPSLPKNPSSTQTITLSSEQWLHSALKSSLTLSDFESLHAHALKTGLLARNDRLLRRFVLLSPSPHRALRLLRSLPNSPPPSTDDPFPYNSLLSSFSSSGDHPDVLLTYSLMRSRSVPPDQFTLPPVIRSASTLPSVPAGLDAHTLAVKSGLSTDPFVCTALVRFYCSFNLPGHALAVFDRSEDRDVVSWNTMVAGLVKCGDFGNARYLFDKMPERNISSWNTMVGMYCKVTDVRAARALFDEMRDRDLISWNTMISGYAKAGDCDAARELFDLMPERDVVSWNAVITSYTHNGRFLDALELFRMMQASNVRPDEVTVVAVLPACARLGALDLGCWVHSYICRHRINRDLYVTAALVDMYGRCGSLEDAQRVFYQMGRRDAFLCSTMIEVLAMHGRAEEAFTVFDYMRGEGIKPNDVTFVGLLKACAHLGYVEIGLEYFHMMQTVFGFVPKAEHFGCLVDLLGRAGRLEEAHLLILSMPIEPTPVVWSSLLSTSGIHGNVRLAEEAAFRLIELEPQSCGNYVLLSNIYSKANRWDDAMKVRKMMKERGIFKIPGCSLIEVNNRVYEFLAGDRANPRCREIFEVLDQMAARIRREGYVPCTSTALHERQQALLHHSEKLALAFGIISTKKGNTIRIVKNLRICNDCHLFIKLVSKHYDRQVVVRDCHRFHHFSDGSCSCSDYW